mmetsp:Transcript_19781/g.25468  ORF Transcript_19781/g.25468 Transcript_19781/m.25468 type:complete len:169 (-) Transcript_19781:311-817(-)
MTQDRFTFMGIVWILMLLLNQSSAWVTRVASSSVSFGRARQQLAAPQMNACIDEPSDHSSSSYARRVLVTSTITSVLFGTCEPAQALKPRNEALCNTGLFENFLEYRCTPIGNIADEGLGKDLTAKEQASTDSLMSKLGVEDGDSKFGASNLSENAGKQIKDSKEKGP